MRTVSFLKLCVGCGGIFFDLLGFALKRCARGNGFEIGNGRNGVENLLSSSVAIATPSPLGKAIGADSFVKQWTE